MTVDDWAAIHAMPFPDPTTEQLHAICERHGLPPGPFARLPSTGVINTIVTIGTDLLLRLPKDVGVGWRDTLTESVAVPAAMAAGVRTPALVAFDESCEAVAVPFGIYEWWHLSDGEPTTEQGWRDLGHDLALLQSIEAVDDPLGRLDSPGRLTTVAEVVDALGPLDPPVLRRLHDLEPAVQAWAGAPTDRFLHDDIKASNLLVTSGGRYAALIDWGDAGWGDPAIDLRRIPPAATPAVVAGYREVRTPDGDDTFDDRVRWDQLVHQVSTTRLSSD